MAETIYFNGFSAKRSKYGIKISGKVEKIIEELQKHVNSKGYINLDITERREADKYGNTHSVKVDTWEPKTASNEANVEKVHQEAKQEYSSHGTTTRNGITTQDDGLPF